MSERIRFHLDESVGSAIADGLRRRSVDVTTSLDADLISASDDDQLLHTASQGRVLITHDDDFLDLHTRGVEHSGIATSATVRLAT